MNRIEFYEKETNLPLAYIYGESKSSTFTTGANNYTFSNEIPEDNYIIYHNGHSPKLVMLSNSNKKTVKILLSKNSQKFYSSDLVYDESIEKRKIWKTVALKTGNYKNGTFTFYENIHDTNYTEIEFSSSGLCEYTDTNGQQIRQYFPTLKNSLYYSITWIFQNSEENFYSHINHDVLETENNLTPLNNPKWYFVNNMLYKVLSGYIPSIPTQKLLIRQFV
jgi:hypothetical protein